MCGNKFSTHEKYISRIQSIVVSINSRMSMIKAKSKQQKETRSKEEAASQYLLEKRFLSNVYLSTLYGIALFLHKHIYCNARHKAMCT